MAVYVDSLVEWGWVLRGRSVASCHLFTDTLDLTELHAMAAAIGMKRSWFQDKRSAPHYDLTASRRARAVELGAIEVDRRQAAAITRGRRALATLSVQPRQSALFADDQSSGRQDG